MNERYDIRLDVVTPLAVGVGNSKDWIRGVDYVVKDDKAYILDLQKVVKCGVDVNELSGALSTSNEGEICRLLGDSLESSSRYVFDVPVLSNNPIKAFLRNQLHDKPLVAGSSLKGAVRSMLFSYFRQEDEEKNSAVFGNLKDGTDFMRFIQVGDVEMTETKLVNARVFNLWKEKNTETWHGGWKNGNRSTSQNYTPMGFNTLYECVLPGCSGTGNIKFLPDSFMSLLQNPKIKENIKYEEKKNFVIGSGVETLFGIINDATLSYLQRERKFFEKYSEAEHTDKILDCITELESQIASKEDNSYCILKMSAGSGFHSITGDWKFDDFTLTGYEKKNVEGKSVEIPKYKSRKVVEYGDKLQLMGFVKLSKL